MPYFGMREEPEESDRHFNARKARMNRRLINEGIPKAKRDAILSRMKRKPYPCGDD